MPRALKPPTPVATALAPCPRNLFVGTSGWAYPSWKPGFYPDGLPARAFLSHYAAALTSVEVNYTFRTLPTAPQLQGWLDATPPGFRFSFKAPQRITHYERLRPTEALHATLGDFLAAVAPARTAGKLGPLLFQLPPNFKADPALLAGLLAAPAFATYAGLQIAFEFRHPTWFAEDSYAVLRQHNAALCVAESEDLVTPDVATADFRCYRLRCAGGYTPAQLQAFASRFSKLAVDRATYVYLKHEDEPTGALNALALLAAAASKGRRARKSAGAGE